MMASNDFMQIIADGVIVELSLGAWAAAPFIMHRQKKESDS